MKNLCFLSLLALLFHDVSGAATSRQGVAKRALAEILTTRSNVPYLDLLLNPSIVPVDPTYFKGLDYEKNDLKRLAFHWGRIHPILHELVLSINGIEQKREDDIKYSGGVIHFFLNPRLTLLSIC